MGYMRHHAIVVTTWSADRIQAAHAEAQRLGCIVTGLSPLAINGYQSFLIAPDGSKEGWDTSTKGDAQRDQFIEWIDRHAYEDGSNPYDWAEVQFGDGELDSRLLRSSDESYAEKMAGR